MSTQTSGIHHVRARTGDPRRNVDFYAGNPGSNMTFLPRSGAPAAEGA